MRDPYLYKDSHVLKNLLNIKDSSLLEQAEADFVVYRLKDLTLHPLNGDYHTPHLLQMHKYIFQDIYEWAGMPRIISIFKEEGILGGQSIEYSDPFNILSDLHFALKDMREKEWSKMDKNCITKEFSKSMAQLWKIHPFREGNTRTTVTFCCQFTDYASFPVNRKLFEENAVYLITALVAYNAYFADGTDFSKKEYLEEFIFDSLQ